MPRIDLEELAFDLPEGSWERREVMPPSLPGLDGFSSAARAYELTSDDGSRIRVHVGPHAQSADDQEMHERIEQCLTIEWTLLAVERPSAAQDELGASFFPGEVYTGYLGGLDESTRSVILTTAMAATHGGPTLSFVIELPYRDDDEIAERVEEALAIVDNVELGEA